MPPTDRTSDQPAPAPAVPGHRPLATDHRPLATDHWPLATDHWQLPCRKSRPALPCKRLRNVLYCKFEPEHNQAGPERAASHNCPPTMPRPPTMSTRSVPNVRILLPANIAPGAAGTHRKCTALPSAAPPTRSGTEPAIQPMSAPPPPGSVSCHKEHAAVTVLRTFCTKTTSSAYFQSNNDREPTAAASCYESPCQYPVTRREKHFSSLGPIWAKQRISIPNRYPADTRIPKDSQPLCDTIGHSSATCGQNRPPSGRTTAYKQKPPGPLVGKNPAGADRRLNQSGCRHSRRRAE